MNEKEFDIYNWIEGYLKAHDFKCNRADDIGSYQSFNGKSYESPHEGLISREIESVGGEGQGDHRHVVHVIVPSGNFEKPDATGKVPGAIGYFKINGYYCSNDGTTWDNSYEVVSPVVRSIYEYR